jgi:hypothetical protein
MVIQNWRISKMKSQTHKIIQMEYYYPMSSAAFILTIMGRSEEEEEEDSRKGDRGKNA